MNLKEQLSQIEQGLDKDNERGAILIGLHLDGGVELHWTEPLQDREVVAILQS